MPEKDPILVVGLGNPGPQYEKTRHNAGFLAIDYFARQNGLSLNSEKKQGHYCVTSLSGKKIFLLKPQTFMNRSGVCVQAFMKYFSIDIENILVVYDDLDLASGRLKMVSNGGAGGHNGIRSLLQHLGSKDFSRLKIGIGHPRDHASTSQIPVERFVLSRFPDEQWENFQGNLDRIAEGIRVFIQSGIAEAMNSFNCKLNES